MDLRLVLTFRMLFYGMQCFFLRGRKQFVENICRKLLSQHRSVGNNACVVVDKRYAIDSACGVDTKNSVDTFRFEQVPKLVPCVVRAHGIADRQLQPIERSRLFQPFLGFCIICLQSFITYVFPYFTRLEGRACSIAVVGQSAVDNTCIVPSVDGACTLLDRNVEQFQQCAKLAIGGASVIAQA